VRDSEDGQHLGRDLAALSETRRDGVGRERRGGGSERGNDGGGPGEIVGREILALAGRGGRSPMPAPTRSRSALSLGEPKRRS